MAATIAALTVSGSACQVVTTRVRSAGKLPENALSGAVGLLPRRDDKRLPLFVEWNY
jgi:hypothetical protein